MKISCTQENLHRALQTVAHIAGRDVNLPVLSNVLISAHDSVITLSATNLEIGITCQFRGKIEEEGQIALDAKVMSEYVSLLPREVVVIEVGEDKMAKVACQNYATKMRGIHAEEFPIVPTIDRTTSVCCKASEIKRGLQNTIFATQYNESRPELSGVFLHMQSEKGVLYLVATDAYRLAEQIITAESNVSNDLKVIIPLKTMQEVLRLLSDDVQTLTISMQDGQVLFATEQVELISKTILGEYPDYHQIIPSNWMTKIGVETAEFAKAVKASSIFATKGLNDVVLEFAPEEGGKGVMKVSASNATIGENVVTIPVEYTGEANRVVVNHRYLLEGLQHLGGAQLTMTVIDNESPCTLRTIDDEKYLYLVMPIRQ